MTATQIYSALLIFMEYQLENVSFYTGKGINHSDVLNKLCIISIKYLTVYQTKIFKLKTSYFSKHI